MLVKFQGPVAQNPLIGMPSNQENYAGTVAASPIIAVLMLYTHGM